MYSLVSRFQQAWTKRFVNIYGGTKYLARKLTVSLQHFMSFMFFMV